MENRRNEEMPSMGRRSRNIDVIKDADGNNIVMINDIRFKGKRSVNWDDVKEYLRNYDLHCLFILMMGK